MDETDWFGGGMMGMGTADPWSGVPYNAGGSYSGGMIPGSGTYAAPDWYAGNPFGSPESLSTPSSPSAVPGTSGAPSYTLSATPGGVATNPQPAFSAS
jgi:hypothetical protein